MVEQSKFAGALRKLDKKQAKAAKPGSPAEQPVEQSAAPAQAAPESGKANRGGKRSNPEYSPTTFFVRKETKRKAARLLEDMESGQDLSDLVEELLSRWANEQPQE